MVDNSWPHRQSLPGVSPFSPRHFLRFEPRMSILQDRAQAEDDTTPAAQSTWADNELDQLKCIYKVLLKNRTEIKPRLLKVTLTCGPGPCIDLDNWNRWKLRKADTICHYSPQVQTVIQISFDQTATNRESFLALDCDWPCKGVARSATLATPTKLDMEQNKCPICDSVVARK